MIIAAVLALLLQAPPTIAPQPVATAASVLPSDPKMIAWTLFVSFATDSVNPSFFTQPPDATQIQQAKNVLLPAGRIKRIVLVKRVDSRYGEGFLFRFECEKGTALERYTMKDGKITSVVFSKS